MFPRYKNIHMVGIGGTGMCGIAEVLLNLGYCVTGSDIKESQTIDNLRKCGAKVFVGHDPKNVKSADIVVVSTAIGKTNSEVKIAGELGLPIVPRAEMLAELMRLKYSIAVAGTHGKTSTTSLIAKILDVAGLDPTSVIGGRLNHLNANAKLGNSDYFVAEADESDGSFLKLSPTIAVITNIDPEHMETYGTMDNLKTAFTDFANKVPFYGSAIVCNDNEHIKSILPNFSRRVITYGSKSADFVLKDLCQHEDQMRFNVIKNGSDLGEMCVNLVGEHQAMNALGALAAGMELGVSFESAKNALSTFPGVARRFQILYRDGPIVVDDYAHHPTELSATINAARRGWPGKRIVVVCQPHRYSRLEYHFDGFASALKTADVALITEVYAAGEGLRQKFTGERLWKKMTKEFPNLKLSYVKESKKIVPSLVPMCQKDDVVLFLGAGDITNRSHELAKKLEMK